MLTLDLRMDAPFAKESLNVKWHCESGFVENIQKLVKEFKTSRNLIVIINLIIIYKQFSNTFSIQKPFKVCILGPPGIGKSTIASQIALHYKIHHINMKDVVTQAIENLNKAAKRAEIEADKPGGEEEAEEEEEEEELPDLSELEAINEQLENNNGLKLRYILFK